MKVGLDNSDLQALVSGVIPSFDLFENHLVKKAGHEYRDHPSSDTWTTLDALSDSELWELYNLCKKT